MGSPPAPRRGPRGWRGCPTGRRRAPRERSAAARPGRPGARLTTAAGGARRGRAGSARRSARRARRRPGGGPPGRGRAGSTTSRRPGPQGVQRRGRRPPSSVVQRQALPGDEDAARARRAAARPPPARPATATARAVTAGHASRSRGSCASASARYASAATRALEPGGLDHGAAGSAPSWRPSPRAATRSAAQGRGEREPGKAPADCRGRAADVTPRDRSSGDGGQAVERRGGSAIAAGSRIAVRLIAVGPREQEPDVAVDGRPRLGVDPQVQRLEAGGDDVRGTRRGARGGPKRASGADLSGGPGHPPDDVHRAVREPLPASFVRGGRRPCPVSRRPVGSGPGFPVTPPGRRSPVVRARRAECGR